MEGANERAAVESLKTLASAEHDFRANDLDFNHAQDFWVGDVAGLYRIDPGDGPLRLIDVAIARADARPCLPLERAGTHGGTKLSALDGPVQPKAGYRYTAIPKHENEKGIWTFDDEGEGRHWTRFAFCAFPAEYGKTGAFTFLVTEKNAVWKKDTGGKPVDLVLADLHAQGWSKLD